MWVHNRTSHSSSQLVKIVWKSHHVVANMQTDNQCVSWSLMLTSVCLSISLSIHPSIFSTYLEKSGFLCKESRTVALPVNKLCGYATDITVYIYNHPFHTIKYTQLKKEQAEAQSLFLSILYNPYNNQEYQQYKRKKQQLWIVILTLSYLNLFTSKSLIIVLLKGFFETVCLSRLQTASPLAACQWGW